MRFSCDAACEGDSRVTLRGSYGLFIGGSFVAGSSVFKTISPATEEVLAEVTHGTTEDVDRAVAAARQAYERVWSMMPGRERARYLLRIARLMRERATDLAVLESLDSGKPIRQTRDVDLPLATAHFFYHAGWAAKLAYAGFGSAGAPVRPLGVVGQVIGWRSALLMLACENAPALACGNTVVLKPAETTPLTALAFAEICADAGLPPGDRQGGVHRFPRGRQGDREVRRAVGQAAHARARRHVGEHRLRGCRHRRGGAGDRGRRLRAPGPRVLRELAGVRPGGGARRPGERRQVPDVRAAVRRPPGRGHRHRRGQLRRPAGQDHRARPLR